jgi:4-hydroxy-tetrahydrodipicolinate reductase
MRLIVTGAGGRMGRALIKAIAESGTATVVGAIEREGSALIGQDAGPLAGLPPLGVAVTADLEALAPQADGIVDFTSPEATLAAAAIAACHGLVHIIGTTGLDEGHLARIAEAGRHTPVIRSGNMSLGVNILAVLVRQAAAALGIEWDIEIAEMHHRQKVDAPSGTALLFGEAAAQGRGVALSGAKVSGRDGITGARVPGTIGFSALRGGTVVGDHSVIFAGAGERIELRHIAEDRSLFAHGALKAALWGQGRAAGLYSMADVLGLTTS